MPRSLSVEDNITLVLEARMADADMRRVQAFRVDRRSFVWKTVRRSRVGELSGGQRRRCEIAITLACDPSFAMLDEPFAGVDPKNTEEINGSDSASGDRDIGVLITDHKARELLQIVDRAYVIESGRVLAEGKVDNIVAHAEVRRVYLGEAFRL